MGHKVLVRTCLGRMHFLGTVLSVSALLAVGLVGCSTTGSVAAPPSVTPRATASATLGTFTSTATATATASAMVAPTITPASSVGWATYRDPRFAFQVPIPPGWQPASLVWPPENEPSGFNYYIVQFFPPGPHGEPGPGASSMAPELIEISLTLSAPSSVSLAQDSDFHPEPATVALGNEQVLLYDRGNMWAGGGEIMRAVETTFGTYPLLFEMHYQTNGAWDPVIAQRDVALYLAMMQGYRPV